MHPLEPQRQRLYGTPWLCLVRAGDARYILSADTRLPEVQAGTIGTGQQEASMAEQMKLRLRYSRFIWSCTSYGESGPFVTVLKVGYGYTPKGAYLDWEAQ